MIVYVACYLFLIYDSPAGVEQFPTSLININTLKVYIVEDPSDGIWTMSVTASGAYSVQVTAKSIVDFTYSFVEEHLGAHSGYLEIDGKPLAGERLIIIKSNYHKLQGIICVLVS